MLQEKNKKLPIDCIKLGIILFLIIASFSGAIFLLIFVYLYFIYEKTKRKIKVLNLKDVFEIAGVYGCMNHFLSKVNPRDREKIKGKWNEYKTKYKTKKSHKSVFTTRKENTTTLGNKKDKDLDSFIDIIENLDKEKEKEYRKNDVVKNKQSYSNKSINMNNKIKNKYNSFNSGKSIWDDYESVLDIMDKNK